MCVLNDLVPFFRFAQFVGLFPFKIKKNSLNGRFEGFHFSYCKFATFWFCLVLVLQIAPLIIGFWMFPEIQRNFISSKLPLIFTAPIFINLAVHYSMIFIIRSATLRYHQLNLAFKYLTCDALRELEDMVTAGYKNAITKKTRIGICLILITVCTSNINNWNSTKLKNLLRKFSFLCFCSFWFVRLHGYSLFMQIWRRLLEHFSPSYGSSVLHLPIQLMIRSFYYSTWVTIWSLFTFNCFE